MILFFKGQGKVIYAVDSADALIYDVKGKLEWLFNGIYLDQPGLEGYFIGPRNSSRNASV